MINIITVKSHTFLTWSELVPISTLCEYCIYPSASNEVLRCGLDLWWCIRVIDLEISIDRVNGVLERADTTPNLILNVFNSLQ